MEALISDLKELALELAATEKIDQQLKQERPDMGDYFAARIDGLAHARVSLEELMQQHGIEVPRPVTLEGQASSPTDKMIDHLDKLCGPNAYHRLNNIE
ncbi:hypothetical protein [Aliagarivorans taiwanensis]|uniref:hypothetical protein n=1 Tax=Aliagarivorans taiwanensis TaxID=561966 RepID=UPI00047DD5FE|nr:hypothetical protein [Aliagarivorans taiwanensis]